MPPKPEMLMTILSGWMLAAVVCAALPLLHAIAPLVALSSLAPFCAAMIIGIGAIIPLGMATRRLSGYGALAKNAWADLPARSAAYLGVIAFGLPVGLMFVLEMYLQYEDWTILIPAVVLMPGSGAVFGLWMRKLTGSR